MTLPSRFPASAYCEPCYGARLLRVPGHPGECGQRIPAAFATPTRNVDILIDFEDPSVRSLRESRDARELAQERSDAITRGMIRPVRGH